MHPNIIIGNAVITSWYFFLFIGLLVPAILSIYSRPSYFPLSRKELSLVAALLFIAGLFGARVLFILLHHDVIDFNLANLFSPHGGFAYFGALLFCILLLMAYARLRRINFMSLLDYAAPFLMLSQLFVRIGCLLAGCCYGKPTGTHFGAIFKSVDTLPRHPAQAYEGLLLIGIFVIGTPWLHIC